MSELTNEEREGVIKRAAGSALRGGIAGMTAQVINVCLFMWMRTTMNFQYRYGGTISGTLSTLYKDGGVPRFYRGLVPALFQAPLSRFGDTAANEGINEALKNSNLPVTVRTAVASVTAACARVFLMPIDAWKTTKQVEGREGLLLLIKKTKKHPSALFQGSLGAMSATFVGHYPFFLTNNYLRENLPAYDSYISNATVAKQSRYATIGFISSVISDSCSNSLRVLKTTRQTSTDPISYLESAKQIIKKDGWCGLFGRGLKMRIATNGCQGAVFTVGWRSFIDMMEKNKV